MRYETRRSSLRTLVPSRLVLGIAAVVAASVPWSASAQWSLSPLTTFGSNGWLSNTTLTSYLVSGSNDRIRSLARNPSTGNLLFSTGTSIGSINATTGAFIAQLNNTVVSTGTGTASGGINRTLTNVTVTSDGVIYGSNLTTSSTSSIPLQIYRWANEGSVEERVYSGNAGYGTGARAGDSILAVGPNATGSLVFGTGTISGVSGSAFYFRIPTAVSGSLSAPTVMTGTGATSQSLRTGFVVIDEDTVLGLAAGSTTNNALLSGTAPPWTFDGSRTIQNANERSISAVVANVYGKQVLATMQFGGAGINTVRLYDATNITTSTAALPLLTQSLIASGSTTNTNSSVGIVFDTSSPTPVLYALNTNNGIQALQIVPEPSTTVLVAGCTAGLAAMMLRRRRKA